jgi:cellulase/cellobiase CelA1
VPGCAAAYTVIGQWPGGFQGEVTVRNTGTAVFSGWTVRWTYTGGERVTQAWAASVSQAGAAVTAEHAGWNGAVMPGATTAFGFIGSGTPGTPPVTCTTR